jgi:hypothetical protein
MVIQVCLARFQLHWASGHTIMYFASLEDPENLDMQIGNMDEGDDEDEGEEEEEEDDDEEEELGFDPWRESTLALQDMIKMENEATTNNDSTRMYLKQQQQQPKQLDKMNSFNENTVIKGNNSSMVPIPPGFQIYNNASTTNTTNGLYSNNPYPINYHPSPHQPNGFSSSSTSSTSPGSQHAYPSLQNGKYYCALFFL